MSTQQIIQDLISQAPVSKLDTILAFVRFVLLEDGEASSTLLSEPGLAKDWLSDEEDSAWEDL